MCFPDKTVYYKWKKEEADELFTTYFRRAKRNQSSGSLVTVQLLIFPEGRSSMINKQKRCRYEKLPSASNPFIINRKNLRHQKEMWAKIHLIKISCQVLQSGAKNKCFISFHWPSDPGNISRRWCRLLLNNPWKNVLVGHLFNSSLLFLYFYL